MNAWVLKVAAIKAAFSYEAPTWASPGSHDNKVAHRFIPYRSIEGRVSEDRWSQSLKSFRSLKSLKEFREFQKVDGQSLPAMIGYVTKDAGRPTFRFIRHNISDEELIQGKLENQRVSFNCTR